MVGFPLTETPLPGQAPIVVGWSVWTFPLTCVLVPPTDMLPFDPTSPPELERLLGGFVAEPSVEELKLPVAALPARLRAPQPLPTANRPPGRLLVPKN